MSRGGCVTPVILDALFTGVVADTAMAGTLTVPVRNLFISERLCPDPSEWDGELANSFTAWSGSPGVSETLFCMSRGGCATPVILKTLFTGVFADTGMAVTYAPTANDARRGGRQLRQTFLFHALHSCAGLGPAFWKIGRAHV